MVTFTKKKKVVQEEKFLPSVIEPSFGIGRILYALLEHSFYKSPVDEQRVAMRLNPLVAPIKAQVFPLQSNKAFGGPVKRVATLLTAAGLSNKVSRHPRPSRPASLPDHSLGCLRVPCSPACAPLCLWTDGHLRSVHWPPLRTRR